MPNYDGPCTKCGAPTRRYVKPGKPPLCFECGLEHQADHNRAMAEGTNPLLVKSTAVGRRAGDQIRERKGPAYEKWLAGILAGVGVTTTTESEAPDTVPD